MDGDQSKTPSVCFADTSLKEGGEEVSVYYGNYSLRRVANINVGQRATVSRGRNRALVAAKPACPPLRSSRLDRSACVSSSHASASHLRGSPISARTMRRFQVRRRQRARRALGKNTPAHPRRGGYNEESFPKIISASKTTLLRSRTQFVPAGHLLCLE